jgi:hypothetical protein
MGEWAWARASRPLSGPWRLGAVQVRLPARGRLRRAPPARVPHATRGHERLHDADGDAVDDGDRRRRARATRRSSAACAAAGEPLNPEAIRWFREQYGVTVLDYYGLTESYPLVANYPFMEVREGSMGKPMPGWDVRILDEDERPVAIGERGEICLRARSNPHYPLGYWGNEDATEETFAGDWFHTKDAARSDDDGYIWYEGRADDVIIAAGYRIGPFEVESACLEHPAVAEAAAVASPDERRGNVVKAFIVRRRARSRPTRSPRDQGVRARAPRRAAYPRGSSHGRAAEDRHRQDPAHRAAPTELEAALARAILRGGEGDRAAAPPPAGAPAPVPPRAALRRARAAGARCSGSRWSGASRRAPRSLVAVDSGLPPRCSGPSAPPAARDRHAGSPLIALLAAYASSVLSLALLKPRGLDELGAGSRRAPRR